MSESFSDESRPNSPFSAEDEEEVVDGRDEEGGAILSWERSFSQREGEEEQRSPADDTATEGVEQRPQWDSPSSSWDTLGVEQDSPSSSWDTLALDDSRKFSSSSIPSSAFSSSSSFSHPGGLLVAHNNRSSQSIDPTIVIRIEAHTFVVHKDVVMQSGILRDMLTDASSQAAQKDDYFDIMCGEDPKLFASFLGLLYEHAADSGQEEEEEGEEGSVPQKRLQHDLLGHFKDPEITNDNVDSLLGLCTKYDVPCLLEVCENYLIDNPTCPRRDVLARKFSLKRLNANCMLDTLLNDPSGIAGILDGSGEHSDELIAQLLFRMEEEKVTLESENCDLQQQQSEEILEHFRIA